jgi:hypothetical protein
MDKVLSESYVERYTREKNLGRGISDKVDILPQEPVDEQNAEKVGEEVEQNSRSERQEASKRKTNRKSTRNSGRA